MSTIAQEQDLLNTTPASAHINAPVSPEYARKNRVNQADLDDLMARGHQLKKTTLVDSYVKKPLAAAGVGALDGLKGMFGSITNFFIKLLAIIALIFNKFPPLGEIDKSKVKEADEKSREGEKLNSQVALTEKDQDLLNFKNADQDGREQMAAGKMAAALSGLNQIGQVVRQNLRPELLLSMSEGEAMAAIQQSLSSGNMAVKRANNAALFADLAMDYRAEMAAQATGADKKQLLQIAESLATGRKLAVPQHLKDHVAALKQMMDDRLALLMGRDAAVREMRESVRGSVNAKIEEPLPAGMRGQIIKMSENYGLEPDSRVEVQGPDENGVMAMSSYDEQALEEAVKRAQRSMDIFRDAVFRFDENARNGMYSDLSTNALSYFVEHIFGESREALLGVDDAVLGIGEQKSALLSEIASEYGMDAQEAMEFVRQLQNGRPAVFGEDLNALLSSLSELDKQDRDIQITKQAVEAMLGATIHTSMGVLDEDGRRTLQQHATDYGFRVTDPEEVTDEIRKVSGMEDVKTRREAREAAQAAVKEAAKTAATPPPVPGAAPVTSVATPVSTTPDATPEAGKKVTLISSVGLFRKSSMEDMMAPTEAPPISYEDDVDEDDFQEYERTNQKQGGGARG